MASLFWPFKDLVMVCIKKNRLNREDSELLILTGQSNGQIQFSLIDPESNIPIVSITKESHDGKVLFDPRSEFSGLILHFKETQDYILRVLHAHGASYTKVNLAPADTAVN